MEMSEGYNTKGKGNWYKHCVLVDKVVILSIRVNNPETTIHSYWYWKTSKRTADIEARFLTVGVITNEKKWLE